MDRAVCMLRRQAGLLWMGVLLQLCACAGQALAAVAYERKGQVVVSGGGWDTRGRAWPVGEAPSFSPDGVTVAFLREGNVFFLKRNSPREILVSHDPAIPHSDLMLDQQVSWHPSGRWVVYTRVLPFTCDVGRGLLKPVKSTHGLPSATVFVHTLWLADVHLKRSRQIIGPMGSLSKIVKTHQPEGASVYEPIFSPDGKWLWFANGGYIYQVKVDAASLSIVGKPSLVARIGSGLDFSSPGASKSGSGAQRLAWDGAHGRLCYWVGRFWGSGTSGFGYISWRSGKWGKPTSWKPTLAASLQHCTSLDQVWSFAFDDMGRLWIPALVKDQECWIRHDGRVHLPPNAQNPDWGR